MTKLNKKLSISTALVVIIVSILSLSINKMFVHKFYLYEKKKALDAIGKDLENMNTNYLINNTKYIEDKYKATIVYTKVDVNQINNEESITDGLVQALSNESIRLNKFWISKETLQKLNYKSVNKIYNQGELKYSLLVKLILKEGYIFALALPIEHSQETIAIINKFNIILNIFSVAIIIILTFILSNKIIKPLEKIKLLSKDIAKLNFRTEEIKTNDEIEELSKSINKMSLSLEKAHNELNNRNKSLKIFIGNASHELKTPVALIKAYAMGIQDGIDDGTYLDTIIEQSDKMNNIVNTLLYWAKYEKREVNLGKINLKEMLMCIIKDYELLINRENINVNLNIDNDDFFINVDKDGMNIVLCNLISNSIKYTANKEIYIHLHKSNDEIFISVSNETNISDKIEIDNIWKPFYVLEKSRSKNLSGTGLGLSVVKEILEAHNLEYGVDLNDNKIEFFICFNTFNVTYM